MPENAPNRSCGCSLANATLIDTFPRGRANRGLTLLRSGRAADALADLSWAAPREPDTLELQLGLAFAAEASGRRDLAARQYRAVLRLRPGFAPAANNLAWLLATSPEASLRDGPEAVRLAEDLVAHADAPDPAHLDTLAAAYAAAGRYEEAERVAARAVALARAEDDELARDLDARLSLYRAGRPYREIRAGHHGEGDS